MAVNAAGRASRTDFFRLARFASCDLLRAHLHSGRTHQIRVHLASIGHPVVGDEVYGGGRMPGRPGAPGGARPSARPMPGPGRQFLHAAWLVFNHPTSGARMDFRSPLPEDLRATLIAVADMPELIARPDPLDYLGFYRVGA
jgi:23S rRNA pseudouridine1911/1915/1917 synthase